MVGPTKVNPRFLRSLLSFSDISVEAGMSDNFLNLFLIGLLFTKSHRYLSKDPNSFWILRNCFALLIVELILSLFRIMDSSWSNSESAQRGGYRTPNINCISYDII